MPRTLVKDLAPDCDVSSIVVEVLNPDVRKTSRGKDFFEFDGRDDSGKIGFKVWEPTKSPAGYQEADDLKAGCIAQIKVTEVTLFRGAPQVKGFTYQIITEDDPRYKKYVDLVRFGPSPEEVGGLVESTRKMLAQIRHPQLKKMCLAYLDGNEERFRHCPAAPFQEGHHGYEGGFAKHVCAVMDLAHHHAKRIGKKYVSEDVVLAGAFLHDIGKFTAYVEKGLNRTTVGRLLGHIAIALPIVDRLCEEYGVDAETAAMVKHIVVSHHGTREYGSPEKPQTIEAEIVAWADMADSRAEAVRMKLQSGLLPGEFVGNAKYGQYTAYVPPELVEEE